MPLCKNFNNAVVLVAPLDWGLGHATRCIPVIKHLKAIGCEVVVASDGPQKVLLESEFPSLRFLHLPGYQIRYGSFAWNTLLTVMFQIPKLISCIRREKKWLNELITSQQIHLVISDHRYGLHNKKVPSIFITHQLLIRTSFGRLADRLLQRVHYGLIRKFSHCWVPDIKGGGNLAGGLSNPRILPGVNLSYIGALSRFSNMQADQQAKHLLVMLSGPEPQRTILEQRLLSELELYDKPVILLRGLPACHDLPAVGNRHVTVYNHLPAEKLHPIIEAAEVIICRSGYSSVMDLVPSGKKCVFIPTPGQPEQVYLAKYLASRKYCLTYSQEHFSIPQMLQDSATFDQAKWQATGVSLEDEIQSTLASLLVAD